MMSLIRDKTF